jgi:hypothetical protein
MYYKRQYRTIPTYFYEANMKIMVRLISEEVVVCTDDCREWFH